MGLLSTLAAPVSGLFQSAASIINTNKTNKANAELAKYSYSKDLEMWNRQNEYNSPSSQMERYTNAGLNPNLIYGTGSASAGNASTMPKYQAPSMAYRYEAPNPMVMLSAWTDLKVKNAEISRINENTESARLQNQLALATMLEKIQQSKLKTGIDTFKKDYTYAQANTENWRSNLTREMYEQASIKTPFLESLLKQQLQQSILKNQLSTKSLEAYSSQIMGQNLRNEMQGMSNQWMKHGGISGMRDVLPWLKMLLNQK